MAAGSGLRRSLASDGRVNTEISSIDTSFVRFCLTCLRRPGRISRERPELLNLNPAALVSEQCA